MEPRSLEELLALSKKPYDPVETAENSIRRLYKQTGEWGISPSLITARRIAEERGEDYLNRFLLDVTGKDREYFDTRKVESSTDFDDLKRDFSSMNRGEANRQIKELRKFLEYHEKLYYTDPEKVEISDYEYDMKMKDLEELEQLHPDLAKKNSVTKRVGFEGGSETQATLEQHLTDL